MYVYSRSLARGQGKARERERKEREKGKRWARISSLVSACISGGINGAIVLPVVEEVAMPVSRRGGVTRETSVHAPLEGREKREKMG